MSVTSIKTDISRLRSAIHRSLTPDLLHPRQRRIMTGTHPVEGHCYVAAEAAFHLLGGKSSGWVAAVLPRSFCGTTHWWIENIATDAIFDPTSEQFSMPVPYYSGRRTGFQCPVKGQPSRRTKIVIDRAMELLRFDNNEGYGKGRE